MRLRNDRNFDQDLYSGAIHKFLTVYPNGELRKSKRRVNGYQSHTRSKQNKTAADNTVNIEPEKEISLSDISIDDWSSSTDTENEV